MSSIAVDRAEAARWQLWSLALGVIALVVCIIGAFFDPTQFFRAYLAAYLFYLGIGLGGLAIVLVYHLTGGVWGFLIRRILEAQMRTLPLLAVLFTPVACGIGYLYLWAQPEVVAGDEAIRTDLLGHGIAGGHGRQFVESHERRQGGADDRDELNPGRQVGRRHEDAVRGGAGSRAGRGRRYSSWSCAIGSLSTRK
jgi:hypothetical protein